MPTFVKPTNHHLDGRALDLLDKLTSSNVPPGHLHNTVKTASLLEIRPGTLELYRSVGAGPRFIRRGRNVYYRHIDIIKWLRERATAADTATYTSTQQYDPGEVEQNHRGGRPRGAKVIDGIVYVPQGDRWP
jgi:hypothetical protein